MADYKYLRISTDDGMEESCSITNQRLLIDKYITENENLSLKDVIEIIDDGYSGTDFERPGIKRLLNMVNNGLVNSIFVKDFSRLGRNYLEVSKLLEMVFPSCNVRLVAVNEGFDSNDYIGRTPGLAVAFKNFFYGRHSRETSFKVKNEKKQRAISGRYLGVTPLFGYIKGENGLIIDSSAAKTVKKIYAYALEGMSVKEITNKLNNDGIITPMQYRLEHGLPHAGREHTGAPKWSREAVRKILNDEQYTGKTIYGKKKRISVGNKKKVNVPKSDWIIAENAHEAIISNEDFRASWNMRKHYSEYQPRIPSRNPLRGGIVKCGHCKCGLVPFYNGLKYLKCQTYLDDTSAKCGGEHIFEEDIENALLEAINMQIKLFQQKAYLIPSSSDYKQIQSKIIGLKNEKIELYISYKDNRVSQKNYTLQNDRIQTQINQFKDDLKKSEKTKSIINSSAANKYKYLDCLTNKAVKDFVKALYVYDTSHIEIVWNFNDFFR